MSGKPRFSELLFLIIGLILPWLPVFIADTNNNFFNSTNMLRYYLNDQYSIPLEALGRRWLTYAGSFWPQLWGFVSGGNKYIGYLIIFSGIYLSVFNYSMKKTSKEIIILLL